MEGAVHPVPRCCGHGRSQQMSPASPTPPTAIPRGCFSPRQEQRLRGTHEDRVRSRSSNTWGLCQDTHRVRTGSVTRPT